MVDNTTNNEPTSRAGRTCLVVDDDPVITGMVRGILENDGWSVIISNDSPSVLEVLQELQPDCIVVDIMMPQMDGLELCRRIRQQQALREIPVVMLSGKSYEFDRKRAYESGANGYMLKPVHPETFASELRDIIEDRIVMTFWGVRGTLPVPGKDTVRYGGNTSCVSLNFSRGRTFIFDAGTGIKALSDHLLETKDGKTSATLFISHSHWDHINALPFFAPLYIPGNEFEICGPAQGELSVYDIVSAQMSDVYFPITIKEFAASLRFSDLHEDSYMIDGVEVRTMMLNHPGYCLGYRVDYGNRSVCYVTDNEMYPHGHPGRNESYLEHLADFVRNADVLITDSTYFDDEYADKSGWGHSAISEVARLAHTAGVKELFLFHHDPDHTDADIEKKQLLVSKQLQAMQSETRCIAPAERESYVIRARNRSPAPVQ